MVKKNGPLFEDKAIEYIKGVGEALEHIHSKNMTHFDVKPSNIVIRKSDDKPVLIDFGLSKQYNKEGEATSTLLQGVSKGYSPIELYNVDENLSFSPQTDVYSLAATLYYLLEGSSPISAIDLFNCPLEFVYVKNIKLREIILRGMKINKDERFFSVNTFLLSLIETDDDKTIIEKSNILENEQFKAIFQLAQRDDANAQYTLGMWYHEGNNKILKNIPLSIIWLNKAAENNNVNAILQLAKMYLWGKEVTRNLIEASKWLLKAHERGYSNMLDYIEEIGDMYYLGLTVKKDINKAVMFWEMAGNKGNSRALKKSKSSVFRFLQLR